MEVNEYTVGQDNFNLPHDVVTLPTGGIFYKSKKKSVKVGYLTANDENLIMSSVQRKSENIVISLLRGKIYEPDLKVNELLPQDVEALLIFLRNSSFGPEYKLTLTDPKSGNDFTAEINLEELNLKKPNQQPNPDGTYDIELPRTKSSLKIRPLSYVEEDELEKMSDNYPQGRVAPVSSWRLNKQIVELNGSRDRQEISKFIESMPIMDSKYIKTFLRENVPSLDLTRQIQAPSGEMVNVNITFGVEFFRPFF